MVELELFNKSRKRDFYQKLVPEIKRQIIGRFCGFSERLEPPKQGVKFKADDPESRGDLIKVITDTIDNFDMLEDTWPKYAAATSQTIMRKPSKLIASLLYKLGVENYNGVAKFQSDHIMLHPMGEHKPEFTCAQYAGKVVVAASLEGNAMCKYKMVVKIADKIRLSEAVEIGGEQLKGRIMENKWTEHYPFELELEVTAERLCYVGGYVPRDYGWLPEVMDHPLEEA